MKYKQYAGTRKEFRKDLRKEMYNNPALAMLAIETYCAYKHRRHIIQIWELLGIKHRKAYEEYCQILIGKHLTGENKIMKSLYYGCNELWKKYYKIIPERIAMGDAYGVALSVLKNN